MITRIKNGRLVLDDRIDDKSYLYFEDGKIKSVTDKDLPFDAEIDAEGRYVSPGFIDMHVHGGGGYDFMDGGCEPIIKAAQSHKMHGTTSLLATSLACSTPVLVEFLNDLKTVMEGGSATNIIGAHLEGPYFALSQSGAQNPDYIKSPPEDEYSMLLEEGKGLIKKWSFAPELDGSDKFCRVLIENGVVPSIGHTDAVYDDVKKVYDAGCRWVTHFYSCTSTITRKNGYRSLGVIESTYLLDDMQVEIIADGCHLPKGLLQLVVKQLGKDNVSLVTDSMRGSGMPDGESLLGRTSEGMPCVIEDGVAKLMDRSAFAGSVATADRLVRTMVQLAEVPLVDAVRMMTINPANVLGLENKGQLKEGFDADIVMFNDNIEISKVIINGFTEL